MSKREIRKLTDFPEMVENPFINELVVPQKSKTNVIATKNGGAILNMNTGQIDDDTLFLAQRKVLDKEPFIKLFQSQLKALFGLTQAGVRVFGYFMEQSTFGDKVEFNLQDCLNFTGYNSKDSVFRGLAELLENDFIARTNKTYFYYINPQIFYKGDRIVLVTEYRRKRKNQNVPLNQSALNFENPSDPYVSSPVTSTTII